MKKLGIVSTFSDKGYHEYGRHFVESVRRFVDPNITVYIYVDNTEIDNPPSNFVIRKLEPSVPELTEFKKRNAHRVPGKFIYDGVRFSHKSYCIWHCANNADVDTLYWIDSDAEIYSSITEDYLKGFLPEGLFTSYLGRPHYTETGFLAFDLNHKYAKEFFDVWKEYYTHDTIYDLAGQLDCHAFDAARERLEKEGKIHNYDIARIRFPELGKNHFNAALEHHVIHYKGDRKLKRDEQLARAIKRMKKGKR
jgi:hypothetical protein